MKPFLSQKSLKTLVTSLVLSKLDYCNSLLAGLPDVSIKKLQRVQNHAARMVLSASRLTRSTEMLKSLHWLPVKARIQYKIALLCHLSQKSTAPVYLKDMLTPFERPRPLRSQFSNSFSVPRTKLKRYGDRVFGKLGPIVWNSLPTSMRLAADEVTFKRELKTYLFKKYLCS